MPISFCSFIELSNMFVFPDPEPPIMYKMAILSDIKSHSDIIDYFKQLPFYNKPVKKPKVKRLKNIDQLIELPFYEQLDVIKTDQAFSG